MKRLSCLLKELIKISCSIVGAGVFYFAWLAIFLSVFRLIDPSVTRWLWLSAPVFTAAGFVVGIALFERITRSQRTSLLRNLVWLWLACMIGAVAVYWMGPMLIVFGMFALGTAGVVLREIIEFYRGRRAGSSV